MLPPEKREQLIIVGCVKKGLSQVNPDSSIGRFFTSTADVNGFVDFPRRCETIVVKGSDGQPLIQLKSNYDALHREYEEALKDFEEVQNQNKKKLLTKAEKLPKLPPKPPEKYFLDMIIEIPPLTEEDKAFLKAQSKKTCLGTS